jgi:5'-phosphate synthase pdxT subunit
LKYPKSPKGNCSQDGVGNRSKMAGKNSNAARKGLQRTTIGILDLQGDVFEHLDHLERVGIRSRRVKTPSDFRNLAGLIIPGGESTCISRLIRIFNLEDPIRKNFRAGMKIWGTCAGAILLAKTVVNEQPHLGLINVAIERNSFGSQLDSFTSEAVIHKISASPVPLTFIRAPKIKKAGAGVEVLLRMEDYIAVAETPDVLVTVFHPELTGCVAFHRYFSRKCGLSPLDENSVPDIDPAWDRNSWTRFAVTPQGGSVPFMTGMTSKSGD